MNELDPRLSQPRSRSWQVSAGTADVLPALRVVARGWLIVLAGAAAGLLLAVVLLILMPPAYETRMTIAPSSSAFASDGEGSSGVAQNLASLAGVRLSSGTRLNAYEQFLLTLHSTDLAKALFEKPEILRLMFPDRWDAATGRWTAPRSGSAGVDRLFGFERENSLSPEDVRAYLQRIDIEGSSDTAADVLSLSARDPEAGYRILREAYLTADSLVRRSDYARLSEQARFVEERLRRVSNLDHRQALVDLLSDYEKRMMLSQSRLTYAIRVIDPPVLPRNPSSLRPVLVLLASAVAGAFAGIIAVILLHARRQAAASGIFNSHEPPNAVQARRLPAVGSARTEASRLQRRKGRAGQ